MKRAPLDRAAYHTKTIHCSNIQHLSLLPPANIRLLDCPFFRIFTNDPESWGEGTLHLVSHEINVPSKSQTEAPYP